MGKEILGGRESVKVAVAQIGPVFLDKEKTIKKICKTIVQAGQQGAQLIAFPETLIPTYPYWSAGYEQPGEKWATTRLALQDNSIVIPSEDTDKLCEAASKARMHAVIGCNEIDDRPGSLTLYNSLLFINNDGKILGRHRKLVPTFTERYFWGRGDASDLQVFQTDIGRIGGLVCWENHMIMSRAVLVMKGEEFHIAVWPGCWSYAGPRFIEPDTKATCDLYPAIREHAFETQGFVLSANIYMTRDAMPDDFPLKDTTNVDWACGGSAILDPWGNFMAGPEYEKETILYAECKADQIKATKAMFDSLGHYSRFDIAQLVVREEPWTPMTTARELRERHRIRLTSADLRRMSQKFDVDVDVLEKIVDEIEQGRRGQAVT